MKRMGLFSSISIMAGYNFISILHYWIIVSAFGHIKCSGCVWYVCYKPRGRKRERGGRDDKGLGSEEAEVLMLALWVARNRKKGKDRSTERAQDRNRAVKLSVAVRAVIDSGVDAAQPHRPMKRLVLMFYSSANGEISYLSQCQPAIKPRLCQAAATKDRSWAFFLINNLIICQGASAQRQPRTRNIKNGLSKG